jgi:hypothetical protein
MNLTLNRPRESSGVNIGKITFFCICLVRLTNEALTILTEIVRDFPLPFKSNSGILPQNKAICLYAISSNLSYSNLHRFAVDTASRSIL